MAIACAIESDPFRFRDNRDEFCSWTADRDAGLADDYVGVVDN